MDAAGALLRALPRRLVIEIETATILSPRLPPVLANCLELKGFEQATARTWRAAVGANGVEAAQREVRRHFRVLGDQRLVGNLDHGELVSEPLRIGESQAFPVTLHIGSSSPTPLLPEIERCFRCNSPNDPMHITRAGLARRHTGEL